MFITSKNKYLLNDMKIFGTCSIPLTIIERVMLKQGLLTRKQNYVKENCH